MKNRINLYTPALQPVKEILPFNLLLASWGAVIILIGLATGGLLWQQSMQNNVNLELADKLQAAQQTLTTRATELAQRNDKVALLKQKSELSNKIAIKQRILATMKQQTQSNSQGYSDLFLALAELPATGIWLTKINIEYAGVNLHGGALHSNDVLLWIEALKEVKPLMGQDFSSLKILRNSDFLEFSLNNANKKETTQ
ncbi:MAG: hypothetical protein HRU23_10670 [Gammaproteobacteria bacterium]|nr:hypothetical protein [Gammaproteobacteria bacterium]